jgi:hypothetical protein
MGGTINYLLWCYHCGAIRLMPDESKWTYPVGPHGENPAIKQYKEKHPVA